MSGGRERFDNEIAVCDLKVGDEIHLTFMGGDDYLDIREVRGTADGQVFWRATSPWSPAEVSDTCKPDQKVWIRKPAANPNQSGGSE